jgi:hypothetical protein
MIRTLSCRRRDECQKSEQRSKGPFRNVRCKRPSRGRGNSWVSCPGCGSRHRRASGPLRGRRSCRPTRLPRRGPSLGPSSSRGGSPRCLRARASGRSISGRRVRTTPRGAWSDQRGPSGPQGGRRSRPLGRVSWRGGGRCQTVSVACRTLRSLRCLRCRGSRRRGGGPSCPGRARAAGRTRRVPFRGHAGSPLMRQRGGKNPRCRTLRVWWWHHRRRACCGCRRRRWRWWSSLARSRRTRAASSDRSRRLPLRLPCESPPAVSQA